MVPHGETVNRAYQAGMKDANDRMVGEANRLQERKMVEDQAVNMAQQAQQAGFQQGHEAGANQVAGELMASMSNQPNNGDAGLSYGNPDDIQGVAEQVAKDENLAPIVDAITVMQSGDAPEEAKAQANQILEQAGPQLVQQLNQQLGPQAQDIITLAGQMRMQDRARAQDTNMQQQQMQPQQPQAGFSV